MPKARIRKAPISKPKKKTTPKKAKAMKAMKSMRAKAKAKPKRVKPAAIDTGTQGSELRNDESAPAASPTTPLYFNVPCATELGPLLDSRFAPLVLWSKHL